MSLNEFPWTAEPHSDVSNVLDTTFPIGTILIVREPYVKMLNRRKSGSIWVDTPSDVFFPKRRDPILKGVKFEEVVSLSKNIIDMLVRATPRTAEAYKARGDKHFREKDYYGAAVAYTYGLYLEPKSANIRLNRSLAHLRMQNYMAASYDCDAVVCLPGISNADKVKALFRAAQAEYGMARYDAAQALYSVCLELDTTLKDAQAGILRCIDRVRESQGGYDWLKMYEASRVSGSMVDCAEFTGPIKVVQLADRGRGLITTRPVKVGELLVSRFGHFVAILLLAE